MKRKTTRVLVAVATLFAFFLGGAGVAVGYRVEISDPETDLGIIMERIPREETGRQRYAAVALQPEKLAVLGLTGVQKGDDISLVRQVSNLWRITHPSSRRTIRIRLEWKSELENPWPYSSGNL